jgi:hypothetical protein
MREDAPISFFYLDVSAAAASSRKQLITSLCNSFSAPVLDFPYVTGRSRHSRIALACCG